MDEAADPTRDATGNADVPTSLRAQLGATFEAVKRLVRAHVGLARAEAGDIVGEVRRMVAFAALALGTLLLMTVLLTVGLLLFLGEWLLGSLGWGVLLGSLLLVDVAILFGLVALGIGRGRLSVIFLVAVVVGAAVWVALAFLATAIPTTVAAALGTLVGLLAWPIVAGVGVARGGIDGEALRNRFVPNQTIAMTKETIEWVRARTPLVRKS